MAVGFCHTGGPFLLRTGAAGGSLGGTKGARSLSVAGPRLSSAGSFLGDSCTSGGQLHHQRQRYDSTAHGVSHLHLHACLVHELDMLGFRSDMAKVACLLG